MAENLEQILAKSGLNLDEFLTWRLPNLNRNKYLEMQALMEKVNLDMYFVYLVKV